MSLRLALALIALSIALGGSGDARAAAPCRALDAAGPEGAPLARLAADAARALAEVDAEGLMALSGEHFREVMDLPALRDYAQRAVNRGMTLARVDRVRLVAAPARPVPGKAGWVAASCGAGPRDPDGLRFEARGLSWDVLAIAEGPLAADPRERGRMALAVETGRGAPRIADLGVTRATLLGRDAAWYLGEARRLVDEGADPWAAREAVERAGELAYLGHRFRTGQQALVDEVAARLAGGAPDGRWVEPGGSGPPVPLLRAVRHGAAVWPELRVEYLAHDPEVPALVTREADRLMGWLREAHPDFLALFHRVRFAPVDSRRPEPARGEEGAEVRTVRVVGALDAPGE